MSCFSLLFADLMLVHRTCRYQASPLSFSRAGIDRDTSHALLLRSVDLADQARKIYLEKHPDAIEKPLISLSLGPFGAAQSDGSEYTGIYYDPSNSSSDSKQPATLEDMINFHYDRLQIIAAETLIWSQVDLLAFETIPRLDEAEAIKQALERLYTNSDKPQHKPAYISFVFPDGKRLPYPPEQEGDTVSQEHFDEIARCVNTFEGVGVNCTKPYFLPELVERLTRAIRTVSPESRKGTKPYLFIYPDGGLIWDGIAKVWKDDKREEDERKNVKNQSTWTRKVMEAAKMSVVTRQTDNENNNNNTSVWQGCFVGGCCKSTTADIQSLRIEIQQMQMSLR